MLAWVCGLGLCVSWAQGAPASSASRQAIAKSAAKDGSNLEHGRKSPHGLNSKDRRAVVAAALGSKTTRYGERDCSHLVHAVYQHAGFPYAYAPSDDLYDGVVGFQRVSQPQAGDVVVWRGHAGIVIRPSRHLFYSFLHAGPGTDNYRNRYWRGRGDPRFYRYLKNAACAGCTLARSR
jgi:cell wall-associated NlpC family hydrolase